MPEELKVIGAMTLDDESYEIVGVGDRDMVESDDQYLYGWALIAWRADKPASEGDGD